MSVADAISAKDILEWTFVIATLDLGVLGFLYNAFVTVRLLDEPEPLAIARFLKFFCRCVAAVLVVLTVVALITAAQFGVVWQVWAIIICLITTTTLSVALAYWMD